MSRLKDDDGRLPLHWAASSNQHAIVLMLAQQKDFDPDVEVSKILDYLVHVRISQFRLLIASKDDSGWTPLMIAASVKDGDAIVELLLSRGADVSQKSESDYQAPNLKPQRR